jgi:hypothetical protein
MGGRLAGCSGLMVSLPVPAGFAQLELLIGTLHRSRELQAIDAQMD